MHSSLSVLISTALLTAAAPGQGDAPPYDATGCWRFAAEFDGAAASNPYKHAHQIHMIPARAPGQWHVALTVELLSSQSGGYFHLTDFLTGTWTAGSPPTVSWNKANAHPKSRINSSGQDVGFRMLDGGDGALTYATYEIIDLNGRTRLQLAWFDAGHAAWKSIPVNSPPGFLGDAALIRVGASTLLVYVSGRHPVTALVARPIQLTPTRGTVDTKSPPAVLSKGVGYSSGPNPLVDRSGQCTGISHNDFRGGHSYHVFSFDLLASTPPITARPWRNGAYALMQGGAVAGGRFFEAHANSDRVTACKNGKLPGRSHIRYRDTYWYAGGRSSTGARMALHAYAPLGAARPILSTFWLGQRFRVPCLDLTALDLGCLGVQLGVLLGAAPNSSKTGRATLVVPVPGAAVLRGLALPSVAIALDANKRGPLPFSISNSAALSIDK